MLTGEQSSEAGEPVLREAAEQAKGWSHRGSGASCAEPCRPALRRTLGRSVSLLRAFRREQTDPDYFYELLAADAVSLLGDRVPLAGARILDVGCGGGHLSRAFEAAGAVCCPIDRNLDELTWRSARPEGAVLGDGYRLPFRSGCADLVVSSNMLEHVARPFEVVDELVRVTRPHGYVWISFTNWYGPWGGHETSPWHYLGAERAAVRYERRHGSPPKNRHGTTMFPTHVGTTTRYLRRQADLEIVSLRPRYHPDFARSIVAVPGLREVFTWNLEILARRRAPHL